MPSATGIRDVGLTDRQLIEQANLRPLYKMMASVQLEAFNSLKAMARERGVSLDRLTREDIVRALSEEQAKNQPIQEYMDSLREKRA